jgi:gamma-glutamylcyclotransferase (GGCT)/AIG2-like uncharacterized protein YtfP
MIYFAYGSNLCMDWLRNRTPSAEKSDTGILRGHRLKFHKVSINDHSGKCNALETGNQDDYVWGVLYEIPEDEVPLLDAAEDLGISYRKQEVKIRSSHGGKIIYATTYIAMKATIDENAVPFEWYKRLVVRGAESHNLPEEYIQGLRQITAQNDSDQRRRKTNLEFTCPEDARQSQG